MYYDWIHQHKKQIVVGIIILFTCIIAWTIVTILSRTGKLPLTIKTVPSDAYITINNTTASNGTSWFVPGSYTLTVSKNGFKTQTKDIIVSRAKEQNVAAIALTPESDTAKAWAESHQREYTDIQAYGAIEASMYGKYIATRYPITKVLPFNDPYYQITYAIKKNDEVALSIVASSPRYRYFALEKLRDLGFNPTDYVIEFKDFHNPLGVPRA